MTFSTLSIYFQQLESVSSRNKMVEILAGLFKKADSTEIDKICYLLQGRVAPFFLPVEFGMADRMMIKSLALASGRIASEVNNLFKKTGDLGIVAEELAKKGNLSLFDNQGKKDLSVNNVYDELSQIAKAAGNGSQELKIKKLASLLTASDPLSCRYIVRIPTAKLRLGFSDMTILDSLSFMVIGDKTLRPVIESAYNVRPDLGFIAKTIKEKGIQGLANVLPEPGIPILMAKAERLNSALEIIEKIGKCAIEPKIDGFRIAVHKNGKKVTMFSRNLEEVTAMYPDLTVGVLSQVKADQVIFEGEAIAFNPKTLEYLPFQETVQRRRKYDIEVTANLIPLRLICFDCLFVNGQSLLNKPFSYRRQKLEEIITKKNNSDRLLVSEMTIVNNTKELELLFQKAISTGLEGVMAKKLDGTYRAGARDFKWIKYKRGFAGRKLTDTIYCLVMGYDFGQGKRNAFGIGDFLIGVYDEKHDLFKTVAKIGTGLTDSEWKEMALKLNKIKIKGKPTLYDIDKMMVCDIWAEPQVVVVIKADEITRSPVHTCGRIKDEPGYALRFPRLVEFRSDKKPEDSTTEKEIIEMFKEQYK